MKLDWIDFVISVTILAAFAMALTLPTSKSLIDANQKHTEAHFDQIEDQLHKLTDRIAALEEKK